MAAEAALPQYPQGMPRIAANNRPPGGRRGTEAELSRRLARVDELLRGGTSRGDVVATCAREFGCASRTADDYIARVRQRWATESSPETRADDRARALGRLDELSKKAEKRGAFGAAVSAERLKVDVLGLKEPERIEADVRPQPCPTCSGFADMKLEDACREVALSVAALTQAALWNAVALGAEDRERFAELGQRLIELAGGEVASRRPLGSRVVLQRA